MKIFVIFCRVFEQSEVEDDEGGGGSVKKSESGRKTCSTNPYISCNVGMY